jgi:hypothetical protein
MPIYQMPIQHMKAYQIHDIVKPIMRMGLMPFHYTTSTNGITINAVLDGTKARGATLF